MQKLFIFLLLANTGTSLSWRKVIFTNRRKRRKIVSSQDQASHGSQVSHLNVSSAVCFAEEAASAIKYMLSQDFDAFEEDCSDAVCKDIDGEISKNLS